MIDQPAQKSRYKAGGQARNTRHRGNAGAGIENRHRVLALKLTVACAAKRSGWRLTTQAMPGTLVRTSGR
jgi:hypothetical protein